jgi:hypothetical protein
MHLRVIHPFRFRIFEIYLLPIVHCPEDLRFAARSMMIMNHETRLFDDDELTVSLLPTAV